MPDVAPCPPSERVETLDVTRGFALLGILLMNILAFGLPLRAAFDPSVNGAVAGLDWGVFALVELFAEGAMRALFSILFGAGVVIFATGANAKPARVYFRRQWLLLAFGLVNAFVLLFYGDILVLYALAGMLLYFARDWSPRRLVIAAGVLFACLAVVYAAVFLLASVEPEQLTAELQSESESAREVEKFRSAYVQAFALNAGDVLEAYLELPLSMWDAVACMLLGMALCKSGVLTGARAPRYYVALAIAGFSAGLAINGFELAMKTNSGYALPWVWGPFVTYDLGRVSMALGFMALIVLGCARGWFEAARRALAAVGRMALTNYLLQSLIGLLVFHAVGWGLWNELPRHRLYLVVAVEWVVLTAFSVWWLKRFRFGPTEWLWRSLTYGRAQPMRK